jgi:hypothetical protein
VFTFQILFENCLPLRARVSCDETWRFLLSQVRDLKRQMDLLERAASSSYEFNGDYASVTAPRRHRKAGTIGFGGRIGIAEK